MTAARGRALSLRNARVADGRTVTLRIQGGRFVEPREAPGDHVLDLGGDRVLPGLINAHDHLQLNHLPDPAYPRRYANAHEWIADIGALRDRDAAFRAAAERPRDGRLYCGGLKSILSGVTTVAHHDPYDASLEASDFPCRVAQLGWSHSLYIDGAARVRASFEATPAGRPWVIHAAEGIDAAAAREFDELDSLGCIGERTRLVHGVALSPAQCDRLVAAGAALIWCPASNQRLFGRTAPVEGLLRAGRVALGTDSRLTGSSDLLEEIRVARACVPLPDADLEALVTVGAARLLGLDDVGTLEPGARADLIVLPAGLPLSGARRANLRLVMLGGEARCGDPDCLRALDAACEWAPAELDGRPKWLHPRLAGPVVTGAVREAGLTAAPARPG